MTAKRINSSISPQMQIEIRAAQAKSVLGGLTIALIANTFIALATTTLICLQDMNLAAVVWCVSICAFNVVRLVMARHIRKTGLANKDPDKTLRIFTISALVAGVAWASVPVLFVDFGTTNHETYIVFIVAGISAGALIQSVAYSGTALAFIMPALIAVDISLFASLTVVNIIISTQTLLLTVMMARSALSGEKQFIASVKDALEAQSLAKSLGVANDEISETARKLEILANHDSLTGLANRASFNTQLHQHLDEGHEIALIMLDLDRFKAINDTYGHAAGDDLLVEFATRLYALAAPGDTVARLGGDEFSVILHGAKPDERANRLAGAIIAQTLHPITVGDRQMSTGCSAGIALAPKHSDDADTLMLYADLALYAAKENGKMRAHVFDEELKEKIDRRQQIEGAFNIAIETGGIIAAFQPQINMTDNTIAGFETLLRWNHPSLGMLPPQEVVKAAAESRNEDRLMEYMARETCNFIRMLQANGHPRVPVALNVSPRLFAHSSPISRLVEIVEEMGVDPKLLEIEITEETMLDMKYAKDELALAEDVGFKLSVDDFGMGHSSLVYLSSLKIDRLKIDRQFITGLAENKTSQALVSALILVGKSMGIEIVAEGVEQAEDARMAASLGCKIAQGYYYAQAMPAAAAAAWSSDESTRLIA